MSPSRTADPPPVRRWLQVPARGGHRPEELIYQAGRFVVEVPACRLCRVRRAAERGPYRRQWCRECGEALARSRACAERRPAPAPAVAPVQLELPGVASFLEAGARTGAAARVRRRGVRRTRLPGGAAVADAGGEAAS